jgi:hypothetical protein
MDLTKLGKFYKEFLFLLTGNFLDNTFSMTDTGCKACLER